MTDPRGFGGVERSAARRALRAPDVFIVLTRTIGSPGGRSPLVRVRRCVRRAQNVGLNGAKELGARDNAIIVLLVDRSLFWGEWSPFVPMARDAK